MDSIIFDVDGTLWDSTPVVAKAWTKVFAAETNYHMIFSPETLQALFGRTLPVIAEILMPDLPAPRRLEIIETCCEEEHRALLSCRENLLFTGVRETLRQLSRRFPLYLVSNCEAGYIDVFFHCTGLGSFFQDALCPGDTGLGKAENILQMMKKHNLRSPIYVGDTAGDEAASRQAEIPFFYASYGFGRAVSPDSGLSSFSDLLALLH